MAVGLGALGVTASTPSTSAAPVAIGETMAQVGEQVRHLALDQRGDRRDRLEAPAGASGSSARAGPTRLSRHARLGLLWALLGAAIVVAALVPRIPQDPAYHRLADERAIGGIPNAWNVLSNGLFVLVGALGLWSLRSTGGSRFAEARERWPYAVFFAGLGLTGLGSAYYHLAPDNERLMWDRLPLALTLMGLLAITIMERINVRAGLILLGPVVAAGIASVLSWSAGERRGQGDLRLYALVQFYPMVAIPLMALLFPSRYTRSWDLLTVVALYGLAKLFEALDAAIFRLGGVVSGHTLKHLAAALAGYWIWRMLVKRQPAGDATRRPGS